MTGKNLLFLVVLALSLGLSAFFAGAKMALVSLSRIDLRRLRERRISAVRYSDT